MSPKQYAQYQQLMFAKQLLHSSSISVTEVGFAAGFNSTRRFNDAFKKILQLTPSQVRRKEFDGVGTNRIVLPYRGALNWQHMLDFYRLRAIEGMEEVTQDAYQRNVLLDDCHARFKVTQGEGYLEMEFDIEDVTKLQNLVSGVRRMFDLDADICMVEQHLRLHRARVGENPRDSHSGRLECVGSRCTRCVGAASVGQSGYRTT